MRGVALITVGALVLVIAAALGPAAIAGDRPKTGEEPGAISRADLVGVNFVENCRFSHQAPDDPDRLPGQAGRVASAHVRGEPHDERVLRLRVAPLRLDDVHAPGRHGRLLGADALPGVDARLPAGSDDLLPPRNARRGRARSRTTCE